MHRGDALFRALPLGGAGHVGGNLMVYETADDIIAVDAGVLFPREAHLGIDKIIPDIQYLLDRKDKFRGYAITHGHEDHIGALPYILGDLPGPIFGSKFTVALLRKRLGDHIRLNPDLREVPDSQRFSMGSLELEAIPITHSIPGSLAFAIHTPAGPIIHTGDFKIDPSPIDERLTDTSRLEALGDEGVLALFSDSTNGGRPGSTYSEKEVRASMMKLVAEAPGRMFITTFASNVT